jgi:hypothetical protein
MAKGKLPHILSVYVSKRVNESENGSKKPDSINESVSFRGVHEKWWGGRDLNNKGARPWIHLSSGFTSGDQIKRMASQWKTDHRPLASGNR